MVAAVVTRGTGLGRQQWHETRGQNREIPLPRFLLLAHTLWRTTDVYVINPVSTGDLTMKTLFTIAALVALAVPAGATETTFFTDSHGRSIGSSTTFGGDE